MSNFHISLAIFLMSSPCRSGSSLSIMSFGSSSWVPVTAVAGEKPWSLGIFLIPSSTIGSASSQLCFRAMIAVFRVRCNFSIIPLV